MKRLRWRWRKWRRRIGRGRVAVAITGGRVFFWRRNLFVRAGSTTYSLRKFR